MSINQETLHRAAELLLQAKQRKVLLVEDTAAHAALIRRALDTQGWLTEHVTRGSYAIEQFQTDPNYIVLLDLSLPDMEGLQLLHRLRSFNPQAAIIVVTATDRVSVSVEAMQVGAWDYVVKEDPKATAERLQKAVERAWEKRLHDAESNLISETRMVETLRAERLEAIELVVRTVCHEVNNPLSGVVALSQLLQQNPSLSSDMRSIAEGLARSAQEVREVVDKLRAVGDTVTEFGGQKMLSGTATPSHK